MKKLNLQTAIIGLVVGWLLVFVFMPNLMIIITSFLTRDDANLIEMTFTLSNYAKLLDPLYAKVVWHSFYMAAIATLICLLIGYPFAFIIARMPKRMRPLMLFLVIVPFWTNSLIRTYGLKIFLGTRGLLNESLMWLGLIERPIRIMYTEYAVMIGLVYILLPFMILPLYSSIEKLDNAYLEAARDLGANTVQRFIRVILPLTTPGIIAGSLLVLLPALGMFYVSDLLGGAKNLLIGNVIKSQILNVRDWPFGSAASISLTVLMGLMLFAYWRVGKWMNRKETLA
ncbi:spermidine/putrescine ABC transporter permease PotB [Salinivibrio proteolyticus]|uniref:spermidine/putrescine ABC transporter permease PotB n=1 Tax=Salinivibrio proteolyticus TaxID=334715 RepID=UPI0009889C04|nr:spermidine/putrescine ABC transporter permease PotB [Salinivibrio proteolyticus]OOF26524.1 spermidine/putrescine ABC transporter permease PotB [Salinivibrio proteolyticus]